MQNAPARRSAPGRLFRAFCRADEAWRPRLPRRDGGLRAGRHRSIPPRRQVVQRTRRRRADRRRPPRRNRAHHRPRPASQEPGRRGAFLRPQEGTRPVINSFRLWLAAFTLLALTCGVARHATATPTTSPDSITAAPAPVGPGTAPWQQSMPIGLLMLALLLVA